MADIYKHRLSVAQLCVLLAMNRSTFYYEQTFGHRGRKPSSVTIKRDDSIVNNTEVVNTLIRDVYSQEFNHYGYILSTEELKGMGFIINHKKVYRLMKESGLLLQKVKSGRLNRQWVQWRKILNAKPLDYICMDIKYIYIHGQRRNAYLLAIIDVATRYALGWSLRFSMRHPHVIMLLDGVLNNYPTKEITLRTDNGSQFIAHGLRKYLDDKPVSHEFTHVATPEENAYVESLFSNVERDVIGRFEFESIYDARDVFSRYFYYYNTRRRHHGIDRLSPLTYWKTHFSDHPVRPPEILSGDFVKGDDTSENILTLSSLVKPLTKLQRGLSLPKQVDNKVLNHFCKTVQNIGG